jgi:hypothetical protein
MSLDNLLKPVCGLTAAHQPNLYIKDVILPVLTKQ